jgi:hypothetical protein
MHIALIYCFSSIVLGLLICSYSSELFASPLNENADNEKCISAKSGGLSLLEKLCYANYGIFERLSNHTDSHVNGEIESEVSGIDTNPASVGADRQVGGEVSGESYDKNPLLLALPFP